MKRILVPCDFSQPAINAYRFGLDIARQSKGSVHVLHVIELPVVHDPLLMPVLNFEQEFFEEPHQNAEARFRKITQKHNLDNIKVDFAVQFGAVSHTIREYTAKEKIDFVVMGSHGASGLRELFIGSNAERIVRNSSVPVLIVKNYYKGPIRNIVFPNSLDLDHQDDLIMKVKALQTFFKARLHILWVNTPLNFTSDTRTKERLEAFAKRFMFKDYTINVFNHTEEERGIREFTSSIKGDLIAMGTHARSGIAHLVDGSLAEDVVNHYEGRVWTYSLKNKPVGTSVE
ncbi:MAG TPA: universal stress protein [Chryseosolibacter sp.]